MTTASETHHAGPDIAGEPHFRWLHGLVKGVLWLNLADALFTLVWVGAGLAREANPLMRELIATHPLAFVSGKLALVGLGSLLLWRLRHKKLAVAAICLSFLVYYSLLLWHVGYLSWLLGILLVG